MNTNSVNALLKILEEPNDNINFILINNNKKILSTLLSRCLNFKISLSNEKVIFVNKLLFDDNISDKYLNVSAKKLKNKKKLRYFKKFINNNEILNSLDENLKVAIITPDKDIVENANKLSPAYLVFDNYEIILKWNRSLRFALAVCTLKDKIKNEL